MNAKLLVKLYGLVVPFKSILGSSIENNIYFVELHFILLNNSIKGSYDLENVRFQCCMKFYSNQSEFRTTIPRTPSPPSAPFKEKI